MMQSAQVEAVRGVLLTEAVFTPAETWKKAMNEKGWR